MLSIDANTVPILFRIKITLSDYFDGQLTHTRYEYANTTAYALPGEEQSLRIRLGEALANQGIDVDSATVEVYPA